MTVCRKSGTLVEMIRALDFSNIPMHHASYNPWSRKEKYFDGDLSLPTRIEFGFIMKGVEGDRKPSTINLSGRKTHHMPPNNNNLHLHLSSSTHQYHPLPPAGTAPSAYHRSPSTMHLPLPPGKQFHHQIDVIIRILDNLLH